MGRELWEYFSNDREFQLYLRKIGAIVFVVVAVTVYLVQFNQNQHELFLSNEQKQEQYTVFIRESKEKATIYQNEIVKKKRAIGVDLNIVEETQARLTEQLQAQGLEIISVNAMKGKSPVTAPDKNKNDGKKDVKAQYAYPVADRLYEITLQGNYLKLMAALNELDTKEYLINVLSLRLESLPPTDSRFAQDMETVKASLKYKIYTEAGGAS